MGLMKPDDSVSKIVGLARWQRDWINSHRSINFSGMVQEVTMKMIQEYDPDYFNSHAKYLDTRISRRKDTTPVMLPTPSM